MPIEFGPGLSLPKIPILTTVGGPGVGVDNWLTETGETWLTEDGGAWLLD